MSCPCASSIWDAVEAEPTLAEAYGRMFKCMTFAPDKAWIFAIPAGFDCGTGYVTTLRIMTDELAPLFFFLYVVMSLSGYLITFAQIVCFNRALPRGVRLTLRILRECFLGRGAPSWASYARSYWWGSSSSD